jgi:hypothetical protein
LGDALAKLDRAGVDLRIINLETSITSSEDYWRDKEIHYRMHPRWMCPKPFCTPFIGTPSWWMKEDQRWG